MGTDCISKWIRIIWLFSLIEGETTNIPGFFVLDKPIAIILKGEKHIGLIEESEGEFEYYLKMGD